MPSAKPEVEVKIAVTSAASARKRVLGAGFTVHIPRVLEVNDVYDVEDLRARDMLARWKQDWRVTVRTIKSKVGELAIVQSAD